MAGKPGLAWPGLAFWIQQNIYLVQRSFVTLPVETTHIPNEERCQFSQVMKQIHPIEKLILFSSFQMFHFLRIFNCPCSILYLRELVEP